MICVSLMQDDEPGLLRATAQAAAAGADLVEWRLDGLRTTPTWTAALNGLQCPVIATCRRPADGGHFVGDEATRLSWLRAAAAAGAAWVDIEADALAALGPLPRARTLVSWHDFEGTPQDLPARHRDLLRLGAHAVKLVTTARQPADNARVLALCGQAGPPTVAFCMGEVGQPSRVLAGRFGAPWTYAAPDIGPTVAPGQLRLGDLRTTYRYDAIGPQTRLFGLIGDPVAHSIGPQVHNAAFAALDLDCRYLPFRMPAGDLGELLGLADALSIDGFSVTVPHKERALALCTPDEAAASVGACNTLVRHPEGWRGHNTDLPAALQTIRCAWQAAHGGDGDLGGRRALLLGAGGVARAVAFGLAAAGVQITVCGRDAARRAALARAVGGLDLPWAARHDSPCDLLVNCTPVGMHPRGDATPFEAEALRPQTLVFDTVYRPRHTALLRAAAARGCPTASGLDMFVAQAEAQLTLFTGHATPPGLVARHATAALPSDQEPIA